MRRRDAMRTPDEGDEGGGGRRDIFGSFQRDSPRGRVKGDNLSDADCARNIRHRHPSRSRGAPVCSWMATCKHGDVIASSVRFPARLVLCVHTDVSLAYCSCAFSYCQSRAPPCGCSSVGNGQLLSQHRPGSLYKGITIIRCLINSPSSEPRSAICLGRVHPGSPFHSGRSRMPLPRASCGAIRGIIRCDAICHGLIGLRNWNLPNPRQRRDGFSRCV